MLDIVSIIKKLPAMAHYLPASQEDIKTAEEKLNLIFADDYKEYLSHFWAVQSDIIAISGIIDDEDYNVVELTNKMKLFEPNIPSNFYVIEDVGVDGLVIWQNETGAIYQSIPNREPVKIFDSLADFLNHQIED